MKLRINDLPYKWDQVTFRQGLKLIDCKDTADTLAVFLGLDPVTLRKATIKNLKEVLERINFTNQMMPTILPKSLNGFMIPADLNFQTICRYEDAKELVKKVIPEKQGDPITAAMLENYVPIVGIYAMPHYENASIEERKEFADQFYNSPCGEVMAVGNFTVIRFSPSKINVWKLYPKVSTLMHKLRLVLTVYKTRLAFLVRYFTWKKKHRINVTNS